MDIGYTTYLLRAMRIKYTNSCLAWQRERERERHKQNSELKSTEITGGALCRVNVYSTWKALLFLRRVCHTFELAYLCCPLSRFHIFTLFFELSSPRNQCYFVIPIMCCWFVHVTGDSTLILHCFLHYPDYYYYFHLNTIKKGLFYLLHWVFKGPARKFYNWLILFQRPTRTNNSEIFPKKWIGTYNRCALFMIDPTKHIIQKENHDMKSICYFADVLGGL